MKTALYAINSKYVHSSLAVWYLSASLSEAGYSCEVLEGSINESDEVIYKRAAEACADIYAFSCYIWNIEQAALCAKKIKEHNSSAITVFGGPEAGYRAADIFEKYPFVDYVISGEGEEPLLSLVSDITSGTDVTVKDGISRRGKISAPYIMRKDPPCPYTKDYLSRLLGRIAYIETSRGCPFLCAYCMSSKQKLRFFDTERAKRDIITLANSSTETVKFVDRTFNADRGRAHELFAFIISEREKNNIPAGVTFHFEIAGELVDEKTLELLKTAPAGLFQFEIGVQSFNPKTLSAINRHTDTEKLCRVIQKLYSYGNIHIHTDLIAGLPYEDKESFAASYNKLFSLGAHKLQLGFLKLLHGSDMREMPELFPCEYRKEPPYTVKSTPWLSEDDIRELELCERASDGIFFSGRFVSTAKYLLDCCGMDPYTLAKTLGEALYSGDTPALDELYNSIYDLCSQMDGVRADILRDRLLYDRIANNNSCVIPKHLIIRDKNLKHISKRVEELFPKQKNVRRCVGILYTEGTVIFADYDKKHPVTGLYNVHKISQSILFEGGGDMKEKLGFEYELKRKRTRILKAQIKRDGRLIVTAPMKMSEREIERFLCEKSEWIKKTLLKVSCRDRRYDPDAYSEDDIKMLKEQAKEIIPPLVEKYKLLVGVEPASVKINRARTRFGSCGGKNTLNFSCFLMLYPMPLVEYVVVHELCHIKQHNHSARFYLEIEKVMPDYKQRQKLLKALPYMAQNDV